MENKNNLCQIDKDILINTRENIMFWIENCDNKSSILLGFIGVVLTIVLATGPLADISANIMGILNYFSLLGFIYIVLILFSVIFFILGIYYVIRSLIAKTTIKNVRKKNIVENSLLHFSTLNKIESGSEFLEKLLKYDEESYIKDLASQILINSYICDEKFKNYNTGLKHITAGTVALIMSSILAIVL